MPPERFDVLAEVRALDRAFTRAGSAERAAAEKRYLKSELEFRGVGVPLVRATARAFQRTHPDLGLPRLRALVRALWETEVHELRSVGIALLERYEPRLEAADGALIEALLRASATWASVDWLAANVMGRLVPRHPALLPRLDRWAIDDDFWLRRAALLALLEPLAGGGGDFERFARLAVPMLEERELFIRKALGWVLREVSKRRPTLVEGFLAEHAARVSGLTFREASKHLPAAAKARLERLRAARPLAVPAPRAPVAAPRRGGRG
jgi:3-methyladenine DNA glycosylase AlkD